MRLPSRFGAGTLLVAAAVMPWSAALAADLHPLDPAAPAGVVPAPSTFEQVVPLLDRESPEPSFVNDTAGASTAAVEPPSMPSDRAGMDHDAMGHAAPAAEAPQ